MIFIKKRGIKMPTCQNCQRQWNWKQTFKNSFILIGGMTCPSCEEKQYLTSRMRKRSMIIPPIMIVLIKLGTLILTPFHAYMLAIFVLLPLFLVIYPFFVELSHEEEPLF